jgi:hypothetical protein
LEWNWWFRSHVCKMYITWLHQLACVTHILVVQELALYMEVYLLCTWKCISLHGMNNANV